MKEIELQYADMNGSELTVSQRSAVEVFAELKQRLENIGYLPDEYFLLDREWENGRLIPLDADIDCSTDYGGSEGVYIDVSCTGTKREKGSKGRTSSPARRWESPARTLTGCSSWPPPSPRRFTATARSTSDMLWLAASRGAAA